MKKKTVFILHECINTACCSEQQDCYEVYTHGVFSTEKRANLYRRKHKDAKYAKIDEISVD